MYCIDNSPLTIERITDTQRQIDFYRQYVKQNNSFDTFYESHLAVLETGLRELSHKFDEQLVTKESWLQWFIDKDLYSQGVKEEVIQFIADILYHQGPENAECIRRLFRAGYCYYFANILYDAFKRGTVCLAYPFGHIVWVDTNAIAYDIEGVNQEYQALIPIEKLGNGINDFRHVSGISSGLSDATISDMLTKLSIQYADFLNPGPEPSAYVVRVQNILTRCQSSLKAEDIINLLPTTELDDESLEMLIQTIITQSK